VVVEPRPGVGMTLAAQQIARAAPDGHFLEARRQRADTRDEQ